MPDTGLGDLFRSAILRQGLEDTQYPQQQIAGMMGGMQPEQMAAFFQSPEVQQQFKSFGIDPQAMLANTRQSPFFPNQFMQGHPMLGGFMNRSLAAMAATPEAPLVSGAGSGLSRFAQGAFGGPELLRQYQLRQMMAPMGALGGMMPTFAEQRRRAIEEAIVDRERQGLKYLPQQMQDLDVQRTEPRITSLPGYGYASTQYERPAPTGGPSGTEMVQTGQRPPVGMLSPGMQGQQAPMPGYALTPEQQGGWTTTPHPLDPGQYGAVAAAKETPSQKALRDAQAGKAGALEAYTQALIDEGKPEAEVKRLTEQAKAYGAKAAKDQAAAAGGGGKGWTQDRAKKLEEDKGKEIAKLEQDFAGITSKYGAKDQQGNAYLDEERWKKDDPGTYTDYFRRRQEIEDQYTEAGRALGGTYPGYEYSARGQKSNVPKQNPFLSPGASTGGAQGGGATQLKPRPAGSQVDEAGNVFDQSGQYLGPQSAFEPSGAQTTAPAPAPRQ